MRRSLKASRKAGSVSPPPRDEGHFALEDEVTTAAFVRLWRNEVMRVFSDRMVKDEDKDVCRAKLEEVVRGAYGGDADTVLAEPLVFGDYRHALKEGEATLAAAREELAQAASDRKLLYSFPSPGKTSSETASK